MRILIFGLGSIGRRHVRILKSLIPEATFHYIPSRPNAYDRAYLDEQSIQVYPSFDKLPIKSMDFAVISNATPHHVDAALLCCSAKLPFLIEKPLSNSTQQLEHLNLEIEKNKIKAMVGFQLRFHPHFQKIEALIAEGKIGESKILQMNVGQYLPTWRPDQDYRKTTSALKSLGGGVVFDICHAIDLCLAIMGPAHSVNATVNHISDLEIETEDVADFTFVHNKKQSHIHLNYIDREFFWNTRIVGSKGSLAWDYVNGLLQVIDETGQKTNFTLPETYTRDFLFEAQWKHWLNVLKGEVEPKVNIAEGINITGWATAIKSEKDAEVLA